MAIAINTTTLVDEDGATTGTASIDGATNFHINRIWVFFTSAATVNLQASPDGDNWVTLHTITSTGEAATLSHPFEHLRITWADNDGDLTVMLSQFYSNTSGTV